jgi:hypothetical protein
VSPGSAWPGAAAGDTSRSRCASTGRRCGSDRAIVRRRRWTLPQRTPGYPVRLPELPRGLYLTSIDLAPGVVRLTGALPEWRAEVPRARLEDAINQLSAVGRPLNLIWPARG